MKQEAVKSAMQGQRTAYPLRIPLVPSSRNKSANYRTKKSTPLNKIQYYSTRSNATTGDDPVLFSPPDYFNTSDVDRRN